MIGIYKIINPNNKIYIGQSKNIKRRWEEYNKLKRCKKQIKLYNSLIKYNPINHIFEVIEECTIEQLNDREIYWGLFYNVLGLNGLNLKLGNGRGKVSNETKLKISNSNKGKAGKYKRTNHIKSITSKSNSVKIYQFDINGNFIQEWESIVKAELKYGKGIKDNLSGKNKTSQGFVWSYTNVFPGYNNKHGNNITVIQKSKNGNFIQEWDSFTEIERVLKYPTSNISTCCKGKQKTAYGYIWEYKKN
jgi:group I intron endonuclease